MDSSTAHLQGSIPQPSVRRRVIVFSSETLANILLLISIFTIELGVAGRALRIDLGVLGSSAVHAPLFFAGFLCTVLISALLGSESIAISLVLMASPFLAYNMACRLLALRMRFLEYVFYGIVALILVQLFTNNSLIGFLYRAGTPNTLTYSGFNTEPSFAWEGLFALILIAGILYENGRRFLIMLATFLVMSGLASVMTGFQNLMILGLMAVYCLTAMSRNFIISGLLMLSPLFLSYLFPDVAFEVGLWFLAEHGSWRQLGNLIAVADADLALWLLDDYQALVTNALLDRDKPNLASWIQSAFSWLPFVSSILGFLPAVILGGAFVLFNRAAFSATYLQRTCALTAMAVLFYTSPKWFMLIAVVVCMATAISHRQRKALEAQAQ